MELPTAVFSGRGIFKRTEREREDLQKQKEDRMIARVENEASRLEVELKRKKILLERLTNPQKDEEMH